MTRYGVYHVPQDLLDEDPDLYEDLNFGDFEGTFLDLRRHLNFVATVNDAEDPEEVFEASQNQRSSNWTEKDRVSDVKVENPRSSMVGDVFVSIEGEAYMVDVEGFKEI